MRRKERVIRPYGLRSRFLLLFGVSALLCGLLFFALYYAGDFFLTNHFQQYGDMEASIQKQGKSLQDFVSNNNISSGELQQLKKWEYKQPLLLLELYDEDKCIYSSIYEIPEEADQYGSDSDEDHIVPIQLSDKAVKAVIYSDFTYRYYVISTGLSAILAFALFVLLFMQSNRRLIRYICRLNEEVQILEGGNLEYHVSVEGNDEISDLAKSMNRMRESFQQQIQSEQILHQVNRRLVTEMSHDLRTPLTGIMLYLEILQSHRYATNEELEDYLEKISTKTHQLKQISDHLFEYSLTETPEINSVPRKMEEVFSGEVRNFKDDLSAHGFSVVSDIVWVPCFVNVNDGFVQRIFENITSNIVKYAESSADITICTIDADPFCGFAVMNTCAVFKDQAESSGIGLESIRSMMQQMNGKCTVEQTETAFEISLLFPKV